ncbi:hypothetical protein TSAR_004280 [Trichomalopsis sarcophagae]|uniref:SAM domain-containing protein n=1 Tax=Trichomalopsis sarcophagae TaxID=543379 RepID=A0A232ENX0_9HYME|nr:hypothetical protein TSAR_004280 [Trichomalopsis sarcophagae]
MAVQQSPQQQQNMVLGGERPIMPVVSINPALIGNQIVGGAHQLQALPIVGQPTDQLQVAAAAAAAQQQMQHQLQQQQQTQQAAPSEQAPSMPMLVTSPERAGSGQVELQMMQQPPGPPGTPLAAAIEDAAKLGTPSKKDATEDSNTDTSNANDVDQRNNAKDENHDSSIKPEDKAMNNPLINLANAVNSITNGNIGEETTVLESLPTTVSSKQVPPKAMVKPQVLTHVIEGFVIQEASEPFAVNRSSLNGSMNQEANNISRNNSADKENHEEPPNKRKKNVNYNIDGDGVQGGKCEACGNTLDETNVKLKKDKRFCSTICAKSFIVIINIGPLISSRKKKEFREGNDKQWNDMEVDAKNDNDAIKKNGEDKSLANLANNAAIEDSLPKVNPVKWTVNEVCDFIRNLPGCSDYAEDFAIQEIDGQALMLLKEDHLMSAMSIKLGPALKIVAKIDSMRMDSTTGPTPVAGGPV